MRNGDDTPSAESVEDTRKPARQLSADEQTQVVLAVRRGELSLAEAARRYGVATLRLWI
jgi:transposase